MGPQKSLDDRSGTTTLVYQIQVPGMIHDLWVLSRPWSLIGNLVADPRLRQFDSRWPQTLTLRTALSDRQIDLAIRQMLCRDRQIHLAPDAALRAILRSALRCGRTLLKENLCCLLELSKPNCIIEVTELFSVNRCILCLLLCSISGCELLKSRAQAAKMLHRNTDS